MFDISIHWSSLVFIDSGVMGASPHPTKPINDNPVNIATNNFFHDISPLEF
ncbi:hypothetical protein P6P36_01220 [Clostridium perfringens]|nr:hypothetical protein [Clostridium perfringens]MDU1810277.1 hypothetical protein [Clostridium perfringens]MDU2047071.1 hypothetical protein [Clostridium perfringens]MDU3774181.1 hypothetical protein [Clostridium perfringens]